MDPAALAQATEVSRRVRAILGPDALGIYLYGSAMAGGLRPDSDLDVFVVTARATTLDEKVRLVEALTPISWRRQRPSAWRPVELTIVVAADLRPWRYPPRMDFQFGEWLGEDFAAGRVEPAEPANPDLAILVSMVLAGGEPLHGPPASDLLDPVPESDLARASIAGVDGLMTDLDADTRNVLLTLARILTTVETGEIVSKDAAADFVLGRLPDQHRAVLARARAGYLGTERDRWDDIDAARRLADHLLDEIRGTATDRR